jgi:hypothetical protein
VTDLADLQPRAAGPGSERPTSRVDATAARLADLLSGAGEGLRDPTRSDLIFEPVIDLVPLTRQEAPADVWAVDGGQALVADARCLQLYVTRAATVRWQSGVSTLEDEGELRPHLLGAGEERRSLALLGSPVDPGAAVDVNLLRDWGEWEAVARAVEAADPDAVVLVDGDLQPDWRIPAAWVAALFRRATERGVTLAGVTKHSSLSRGGAPLLGYLERQAEARFGPRACWWARVATTRPELGPGLTVVVARLDPDARFAFRIDLLGQTDGGDPDGGNPDGGNPDGGNPDGGNPDGGNPDGGDPDGGDPDGGDAGRGGPARVLGRLAALADDAAFPGYPYALTVADRLAACPGWVRAEIWDRVQTVLDRAGVPAEVRERAFTDRHRLMERG